MSADNDHTALIVDKHGMIIGHSDMSLVGEKISAKLPEYKPVLKRVVNKNDKNSFVAEIDGADHTIFSSRTKNGRYMILSVDERALYKDSYAHLFLTTLISLVMLVAIVGFYLNSTICFHSRPSPPPISKPQPRIKQSAASDCPGQVISRASGS